MFETLNSVSTQSGLNFEPPDQKQVSNLFDGNTKKRDSSKNSSQIESGTLNLLPLSQTILQFSLNPIPGPLCLAGTGLVGCGCSSRSQLNSSKPTNTKTAVKQRSELLNNLLQHADCVSMDLCAFNSMRKRLNMHTTQILTFQKHGPSHSNLKSSILLNLNGLYCNRSPQKILIFSLTRKIDLNADRRLHSTPPLFVRSLPVQTGLLAKSGVQTVLLQGQSNTGLATANATRGNAGTRMLQMGPC